MTIGAISANALFSLNFRPSAPQANTSVWAEAPQRTANSAGSPATILPIAPVAPLSFDTIINLQSLDEPEPDTLEEITPTQKFLEEAQKSPIERMREQILAELGLSEDALAQMSADERRVAEDKIRQMIEEKLRQAMGAEGERPGSNASMIEVVA